MGTMGKAISLRVQSLRASARKVVVQIGTPRPPDPIMRRPCADREEKRVTRGSDTIRNEEIRSSLTSTTPIRKALTECECRERQRRFRAFAAKPRRFRLKSHTSQDAF